MDRTTLLRWQNWERTALQHLVLREAPDRVVAEAAILGSAGEPFAVTFRIVCDGAWRARELELRILETDNRLMLRGDGAGHWLDADGEPLAELDGALDV